MKSISFNGAPEVKYSRVSPGEVKDFEKFIKGHYHRQDSNFSKSGAHVVSVRTENEYNVDIDKLENLLCEIHKLNF